jgi:hypothetical protein
MEIPTVIKYKEAHIYYNPNVKTAVILQQASFFKAMKRLSGNSLETHMARSHRMTSFYTYLKLYVIT